MTIEFFMIRISVRLFDRSKVTQNKINFIKNCSQWGLNSQPLDHHPHVLPTEISHCKNYALLILEINRIQHVKWCMKQKKSHFKNLQQIPT